MLLVSDLEVTIPHRILDLDQYKWQAIWWSFLYPLIRSLDHLVSFHSEGNHFRSARWNLILQQKHLRLWTEFSSNTQENPILMQVPLTFHFLYYGKMTLNQNLYLCRELRWLYWHTSIIQNNRTTRIHGKFSEYEAKWAYYSSRCATSDTNWLAIGLRCAVLV